MAIVWRLGCSILLVLSFVTFCHGRTISKIVHNHLDWKPSHGEMVLYAIKFIPKLTDQLQLPDLTKVGLHAIEHCKYIDSCWVYAHNYHLENGACFVGNLSCAQTIRATKEFVRQQLDQYDVIEWYSEIWELKRFKRQVFRDPKFPEQWHLSNSIGSYKGNFSLNVTGVWKYGVNGKNVTVAIVDDGLEWNNRDIFENYNANGSIDLNDNDDDPMPDESRPTGLDYNEHGTRCAGEIAAVANNDVCGVGVAYKAKISGVRVLDGTMTDLLERNAFAAKQDINDIYSCSWGPEDDGKTVDGPHELAKASIRNGIRKGRRGYGSIYVVASGNGGKSLDNCNFDGYANSIYFVTIGAVHSDGSYPLYAELCASMLAVAPSGNIVTTDITHRAGIPLGDQGCTNQHSGTSAAAPLAAGVIALVLSVNPCLTWRDIQHLLVLTSVKIDADGSDWVTNHAGLDHSHKHGFGLISAWNIVNAAKIWSQMPAMSSFSKEDIDISVQIPIGSEPLVLKYTVSEFDIIHHGLAILEYVQVTVTIDHKRRGNLKIEVKCPDSTATSVLASYRDVDVSVKGFQSWSFSTVRCWGEEPSGEYELIITDRGMPGDYLPGHLVSWSLTLHGSSMSHDDYQQRIRDVKDTRSGKPLLNNFTVICEPPPTDVRQIQTNISGKVLQVVVILGVFLVVATFFTIMENLYKSYVAQDDLAIPPEVIIEEVVNPEQHDIPMQNRGTPLMEDHSDHEETSALL